MKNKMYAIIIGLLVISNSILLVLLLSGNRVQLTVKEIIKGSNESLTNPASPTYNCYYIRYGSALCPGGVQERTDATKEECESLRLIGEDYARNCSSGFEWNIKEQNG